MARWGFELLAVTALAAHLAFILWLVFGALLTGGRPRLAWVHIASLIYGVFIQVGPWPCPLTLAEQYFQARAGRAAYQQPFLAHYLERLVYPDLPSAFLVALACAVLAVNLSWYALRHRSRRP